MSLLKSITSIPNDSNVKIYYNQVMDRGAMRQLVGRLITYLGSNCTSQILDKLKTLGFRHATQSGISLGVDDLITTPSKTSLIRDAEHQAHTSEEQYRRGSIHAVEKLRHVVETWHTTSEYLKREMTSHFRITDPLNPVHIMSFSGARGNVSQVHQLVGMRGLMASPQGNIIDLPIQSNLREGLSLTEYIISCYGARKGVVDTAVRTADAGYLTRRLVEVVQHIVIRNLDCETTQGIRLQSIRDRKTFSSKEVLGNSLLSLQERLVGRVLARNVFLGSRCIAIRNQDLAPDLVNSLVTLSLRNPQEKSDIIVRSALTCKSMPRACQRCYGWDLSCGNLVEIGAAIGIVAGQSIGEPGTQLTLRTFHTGGVFTGGVAEHVRAPFNGIIHFAFPSRDEKSKKIQSTRNRHGRPAWTCPEAFSVVIEDFSGKKKVLTIPQYSLLLVKNHQYVQSRQIIAEVRASIAPLKEKIEKSIFSHTQGEVAYTPIGLRASCLKQRHFIQFLCSSSRAHLWKEFASIRSYMSPIVENTSYIWIFSGRLNKFLTATLNLSFFYQTQDYIQKDVPIGIRNRVFTYSNPLIFSIYNRQRSVIRKVINYPSSSSTAKTAQTSLVSIFSKHTGSIHIISEQNEWMLTLSCDDQFFKKKFSSFKIPLPVTKFVPSQEKKHHLKSRPFNIVDQFGNATYSKADSKIFQNKESIFFTKKALNIPSETRSFQKKIPVNYTLSKTTPFFKHSIFFNEKRHEKDFSIGLLGNFFVLLKEFSLTSIRTFISLAQKTFFKKKTIPSLLWNFSKDTITGLPNSNHVEQITSEQQNNTCFVLNNKKFYKIKHWFFSHNFLVWCHFNQWALVSTSGSKNVSNSRFSSSLTSITSSFLKDETVIQGDYSKNGTTFLKSDLNFFQDQNLRIGQSICSSQDPQDKSLEPFIRGILSESGHLLSLNEDHLLIRLAKLYLIPTGGIAHAFDKQTINEGNTLVTLAYERLKASDIIQGLPKAEQLLEARVGNQVVINLYIRFDILVARIKEQLRSYIGSLTQMDLMLSQISVNRASKAIEYSQLETVDQVQKVYLSQGVYISDKHFEVIVRQMSNKVAIVENTDFTAFSPKAVIRTSFPYDAFGVFFPGELLEISKAQRMNRVLHTPLPCKPLLLGITQASLSASSFLSEASFERTISVLSRSALQGRIDWLKGLKENVLISRMIPAGTGLKLSPFFWMVNESETFFSKNGQKAVKKNLASLPPQSKVCNTQKRRIFSKEQPITCLSNPFRTNRNWFHASLKELTEQSLQYETKKFCRQQLTENYLPKKKKESLCFSIPKIETT